MQMTAAIDQNGPIGRVSGSEDWLLMSASIQISGPSWVPDDLLLPVLWRVVSLLA